MIVSEAQRQYAADGLAVFRKSTLAKVAHDMPDVEKSTKAQIARWIAENDYDMALELLSRKYA